MCGCQQGPAMAHRLEDNFLESTAESCLRQDLGYCFCQAAYSRLVGPYASGNTRVFPFHLSRGVLGVQMQTTASSFCTCALSIELRRSACMASTFTHETISPAQPRFLYVP